MMNRSTALPAAALLSLAALTRTGALHAQDTQADAAAPPLVAFGSQQAYEPRFRYEPKGLVIQGDFLVGLRAEGVSTIPVDRDGSGYQAGAVLAPMLRAGLRLGSGTLFDKIKIHAEYEHDLPTGYWRSDTPIEGQEMPGSAPIDHQLRKLFLRVSIGPYLHAGGGFMTNHFGLGLLANDGAQSSWAPGSARFADNRGGDRVLRGFIGTGPLTDAAATVTFAIDKVEGDDVLLPGDEAIQLIGTASVGYGKPWGAGIFVVHRQIQAQTGERTDATVFDLAARYGRAVGAWSLSLDSEVAFIVGHTELGPTPEIPVHRLRQLGGVVRAAARTQMAGGVLDVLFASGDTNPDDALQGTFKADPNFETGLLLYRQVLAAQSGRAPVTASNPDLVGVPSPGLERIPTRGSPASTVALFPRAYVRPVTGLEVYGGVLLAWSQAPLMDPLNTRFAGGAPRNALDGKPGNWLGAELDLGARQRILLGGSELTVGVEGAVLLPGDAFTDAAGNTMGPVLGGRALFNYRL